MEKAGRQIPEPTSTERHLQHAAAVSADPDPQDPGSDLDRVISPGQRGRQRRAELRREEARESRRQDDHGQAV